MLLRLRARVSESRIVTAVTIFLFLPIAAFGQTLTVVDVPGAYATTLKGINASGVVIGTSQASSFGIFYGFVYQPGGAFKTFAAPTSPKTGQPAIVTMPICINSAGVIAGTSFDNVQQHGFVRAADGTITLFDADPSPNAVTWVMAISSTGAVAGNYVADRTAPSPQFTALYGIRRATYKASICRTDLLTRMASDRADCWSAPQMIKASLVRCQERPN